MTAIFFRIAIIYLLLSLSMKLMGKREIAELEVGELVTTLIISEICSIPIDDPDVPLLNAIIGVLFIVCTEIIISSIKNKSKRLKNIFDGESIFLIKNGKLNQQALKENRISIEEFLASLRQNGIGKLSDISNCLLEPNGKISVLKKDDGFSRLIISDGEVICETLDELGFDADWLISSLNGMDIESIFIMTVDDNGETNIILKEEKE